jgi:hypothetical protein
MHRFVGSMVLIAVLGIAAQIRADDPPAAAPTVKAEIIYGRKADMALLLDAFMPAKPNGAAVIHLANGGWHAAHTDPRFFSELLKRGYSAGGRDAARESHSGAGILVGDGGAGGASPARVGRFFLALLALQHPARGGEPTVAHSSAGRAHGVVRHGSGILLPDFDRRTSPGWAE